MIVDNTRLRFISSKDALKVVGYCNNLPYKIEIKGNPVLNGKTWFLWFIIPDEIVKGIELKWGDLDKGV